MKNLLEQIQSRLDELNKAERKVAEVILQNPQQATRFSIAALAQAAAVSEPTVNRFCRSFGMSGYPELKIQLAQSLASGAAFVTQAVAEDDGPEAYTRKIFSNTIASLDSAHKLLDPRVIDRAVDLLIQARQIHFFGLGASASVAPRRAAQVLPLQPGGERPGRRADATDDRLGGAYRRPVRGDFLYRTHPRAGGGGAPGAENGASVLGLTAAGSPLARASTLCLDILLPEDTDIYMPMTSRIVQLTVLDVLATGVTLRRGVDFQPHLRRIKESLVPTRYPLDEDN